MLKLDEVTLLGIDCIDIDRLIFVSEICQKSIAFNTVKLLSHLPSKHPNVVKIAEISTIEDYSRFIIKDLHQYLDTDFVLVIQHDGFILNPDAWQDGFLNYDYVGAPCKWGMGNGGFSLRSKKLLKLLSDTTEINTYHPEDLMICKKHRGFLERQGIKFAPFEIAEPFSIEGLMWNGQFGFHNADISIWDIDNYVDSKKHPKYYHLLKASQIQNSINITYVVQFYIENRTVNPLLELIEIYASYHSNILKQIHFVFVDDHSPIQIEIPEDINLNYTLLRIKDDIKWNQAGARNLGVTYAKSDKIILTDLDIIFPENLLDSLLHFEIPMDSVFKFTTISGLKKVESHFNVFFTTIETFMKSKGVDEEFSGKYGYEDVFFYFLQKALGTKFYVYNYSNIVHREHKNSEVRKHNDLVRDLDENKTLNDKKMELIKSSTNPLEARSTLFLNFEWEIVQEHLRINF
ncbi:MAG: DUF5672 family protein [Gelidibacter sp.]